MRRKHWLPSSFTARCWRVRPSGRAEHVVATGRSGLRPGQCRAYTDASSIYANLLDPELSTVADKTGVAVFPAGPAGSVMYNVTSWGLSMPSGSDNKEAACEFIKWATSKEIVLKTQVDGAVPGARVCVGRPCRHDGLPG